MPLATPPSCPESRDSVSRTLDTPIVRSIGKEKEWALAEAGAVDRRLSMLVTAWRRNRSPHAPVRARTDLVQLRRCRPGGRPALATGADFESPCKGRVRISPAV